MPAVHRIETIERLYPDQWVVVEVTRVSRTNRALNSILQLICGLSTPAPAFPKG
jgi:hypothetical protein